MCAKLLNFFDIGRIPTIKNEVKNDYPLPHI